jgi:hypothetical protein
MSDGDDSQAPLFRPMGREPLPNRHATNRRVFNDVDAAHPLLKLYSHAIALELSLKDHRQNFESGHDVGLMATTTFSASSGVAAAVATFNGDLAALMCTDRKGVAVRVPPTKYPNVRYLRLASDFDPPSTSDDDLLRALKSLDTLIEELRKEGLPWP